MAPIIDVNEKDFERAKQILTLSGVKYSPIEKERIADLQADAPKGFIYVPTIKMYVSRERVGFNENFENQQRIAREEGGRMITIPEFKEVLKYARVDDQKLYNEITEIRSPWRAERLDALFDENEGELDIITHNGRNRLNKLVLRENQLPGISMDSWLGENTKQGLPSKKVEKGNLFYSAPRDGAVASFDAFDVRSGLDCYWLPSGRDSDLGVRVVKQPQ